MEKAGAVISQLVLVQYNVVVEENRLATRGAEALHRDAIARRIRTELEGIVPGCAANWRPRVMDVVRCCRARHAGPRTGVGPVVLLRRRERRRGPALRSKRSSPGLPPLFRVRDLNTAARERAVRARMGSHCLGGWLALDRSKLLLRAHAIDTSESTHRIEAVGKAATRMLERQCIVKKRHFWKWDIELLGERLNIASIRNATVRHAHRPVANDDAALPYLLWRHGLACIAARSRTLMHLVLKETVRYARATGGGPARQSGHVVVRGPHRGRALLPPRDVPAGRRPVVAGRPSAVRDHRSATVRQGCLRREEKGLCAHGQFDVVSIHLS